MSLTLPTPETFSAFPYNAYPIQIDLMRHLYTSIEQRKVTIVESPTGTGKTSSLLCASLTWLADEKNRARKGTLAALDEPSWVAAQTLERKRRELEADEREYDERLAAARKKEIMMGKMAKARVTKKPKLRDSRLEDASNDDNAFLPETETGPAEDNIAPAVRALMAKLNTRGPLQRELAPTCTKVYYASRTHSQLAQILPELHRLNLAPLSLRPTVNTSLSSRLPAQDLNTDGHDEVKTYFRMVSLGSRKQLCINDDLRANRRDLDEACQELLGRKQDSRCGYLPPVGEDDNMIEFRDQILAFPKDIEELAAAGRLTHTCPYFGSRYAIPQAELVTLPYNLLLQKAAREALGINLKDQIIIIDEAHNLIPTLLSLSTVILPLHVLSNSLDQVSHYMGKFRTRLSATHLLPLKKLVVFLDSLKTYMLQWQESSGTVQHPDNEAKTFAASDLLQQLGRKVIGLNLLEIETYLQSSKIARKISRYFDEIPKQSAEGEHKSTTMPPLHIVEAFMVALTNENHDGRVTLFMGENSGQSQLQLKYQLLNPSTHFLEVIEAARCIILAGGTMSPMSDFTNQLFSHLPISKISSFSCGHIIPSLNIKTLVVGKGPGGSTFEFKYQNRENITLITELGQTLINFVNIIPGGVVVFVPSYKFLDNIRKIWDSNMTMNRLNNKKKVFFEPANSSDVDMILGKYAAEIQSHTTTGMKKGALLFAVIGAKLSEGLNFSDDLARAVIVIGLPFPNLHSPDLQERMKYVKKMQSTTQPDAATELYENICMNAVNQSIGRAIRHKDDWASIILIDNRYGLLRVQHKLPKWIENSVVMTQTFGQAVKELGRFYHNK